MNRNYDLIVFDWDGTLMDSTAVIAGSIQAACRDLGVEEPDDATARHVIGLGLAEALCHAVPHLPAHRHGELADRYRYHFLAQDGQMPLYAGARDTLDELRAAEYLLAVATGKSRAGLDRVLDSSGLRAYFHASRTADETFSKPHPAMLHELMEDLMVAPERVLMIGDTTHDLQLALNAGVDAVGMTHGAHPEEALQELEPLALVEDFVALRIWLRENA